MIPQYRTLKPKLPNNAWKKAQYRNTLSPHFPLHAVEEVVENLGLKHPHYI